MHFLLFSVLCSVTVSILLKLGRRYHIDIRQAIASNYIMAITLGLLLLQPDFQRLQWTPNSIGVYMALGLLLPSIFMAMHQAVQKAGIVRSDAAQRLSLFLPVVAAFVIFQETLSWHKGISLAVALCALLLLLSKPHAQRTSSGSQWWPLLLVWVGYGVIDILFKQMSKMGTSFSSGLLLTFAMAAVIMFTFLVLIQCRFHIKHLLAGLLLGTFNFGNILFYVKAHQHFQDNPTLVFITMNIGVISLGTLVGAWWFREKVSVANYLGVVMAMGAVLLLYLGG